MFEQWWKSVGVRKFRGYSDAELVSIYAVCRDVWNAAINNAESAIVVDGNPVVAKEKIAAMRCAE